MIIKLSSGWSHASRLESKNSFQSAFEFCLVELFEVPRRAAVDLRLSRLRQENESAHDEDTEQQWQVMSKDLTGHRYSVQLAALLLGRVVLFL